MNLLFRLVQSLMRLIEIRALTDLNAAERICDARSEWSDGVVSRCRLTPGHEGEHMDGRDF